MVTHGWPGQFAIQEAATGQPWSSFTQTSGNGGYSVSTASGVNAGGNDFGNFKNVALSGTKWEDHNGNGIRDAGDQGLAGWTINVVNQTATTDVNGNWSLTVGPGTFAIKRQRRDSPGRALPKPLATEATRSPPPAASMPAAMISATSRTWPQRHEVGRP